MGNSGKSQFAYAMFQNPVLVIAGTKAKLFIILFKLAWRVAEPNEALIISGMLVGKHADANLGFKIITGKGTTIFGQATPVQRNFQAQMRLTF